MDKKKQFIRKVRGERVRSSPLGGYVPYREDMVDTSYYLSEERLREALKLDKKKEPQEEVL